MSTDGPEYRPTSRRALLRRIGLATGLAYLGPGLAPLSAVRADDDDDDDDGGDDDDTGGGGAGGGTRQGRDPSGGDRSPTTTTRTRRQTRTPRQSTRRAPAVSTPPPPPEVVVLVAPSQSLQPAIDAGYRVLSEAEAPAIPGRIARLALPQGRSLETALAEMPVLLPGALADENHVYAPNSFSCDAGDCEAQAMIGWSGWPSAMAPRIGMIDTGINLTHPALQGQKLKVHQVDLGDRPAAGRQHGTAIAALLIGRVEGRVPGLLPLADLVAVEGFHRGAGGEVADAFTLVRAMDILLTEGVSVINLSFSGPANAVFHRIVQRASDAGIGLVAAAGNGGPGAEPAFPAAWPEVIAVTAVDQSGAIYRQANQGPYVMLAAPGVNLWTAASISGGRLRSGTSYAAPFVTASLAVERLRAPGLSMSELTQGLLSCARDLGQAGFDPVFGHGLLSAPGQCRGADVFVTSGE